MNTPEAIDWFKQRQKQLLDRGKMLAKAKIPKELLGHLRQEYDVIELALKALKRGGN